MGKDVPDILGYQNGSRDINRHVDEDKGVAICDTLGGSQNQTVINESGLYSNDSLRYIKITAFI